MSTNGDAFVTGGTGLIGRFVVEALLRRGAAVTMLVRESSRASRAARIAALEALADERGARLELVDGDLAQEGLALDEAARAKLASANDVFHLAAIYDIEAEAERLAEANVEGTRRLLDALKEAGFSGRLHHVSSIAVAGDYQGTFTESMFDMGQGFQHAYHRSKYESEALVRESGLRQTIYRPAMVVGHSKTGEMDRVDGPYYGFPGLRQLAWLFPRWARVPIPRIKGRMNVVPVDFVAEALVAIASNAETEGEVFQLVDPKPPRFRHLLSDFLDAMNGPHLGPEIDLTSIPGIDNAVGLLKMLPSTKAMQADVLGDLGLPAETISAMNLHVRYDDAHTRKALEGTGIACPPLRGYARNLVRYYEDHLDPTKQRPARYARALGGKKVVVTGASRGIGADVARQAAAAGAELLLVARSPEPLQELAQELREAGGNVTTYATDLSDLAAIDALAERILEEHGGVDVLINNAARSIRRPIAESLDRFHDFERTMALNYFGPVRLTLKLLPSLRERGGRVANVLTIGVLIPGPYFAAYMGSKGALQAFGDSLMAEFQHEKLHIANIYLPLVKTEMLAPTGEYSERKDLMTPEKAAHMVLDGVVDRRRRVMTPLGRYYGFANLFMPRTTTRILNLLHRTFPAHDEPTAFPVEHALIQKMIGGSPI